MGSLMHVSTSMHAGNGVKMSWVTLERITREEAAKDDSLLRKLHVDRRPLRPTAAELTDHELLDNLRSMESHDARPGSQRRRLRRPPQLGGSA